MSADTNSLNEGAKLAKEGRYDEAIIVFDRILATSPDDPEALFFLGACHFKKGNSDEARSRWERVLQIDSHHEKAKRMLAQLPTAEETPEPPPPPKKATAAKTRKGKGWIKWAVILAVVLIGAGIGADMYVNPNSYPFLRTEGAGVVQPPQTEAPQSASEFGSPQEPSSVSLEDGLPGRWTFKWEGDPASISFFPGGRVKVTIDRAGGIQLNMEGTYEVNGTNVALSLKMPDPSGGEASEEVSLYNAQITESDLTFNLQAPEGPSIRAYKQ